MPNPLDSLINTGTRLWLDSVDPELVEVNRQLGATGATSNPVIISGVIKTGRFDGQIDELIGNGLDDEAIAWELTDRLVRQAQEVFADVHHETAGDDGYVSFELDPLLEDPQCPLSLDEKTERYIALGKQWSAGHRNRMIKVPATPAGLAALEQLAADGVKLNVTLIFTGRQYEIARDAIWRGFQRRLENGAAADAGGTAQPVFKSVYSIFISRIDVYSKKHVPGLSAEAQGMVGIVNAKRLWLVNQDFWKDKRLPLRQEIVFASTGTKDPADPPDKYVSALAGSDIQTNPPETNAAILQMGGRVFSRTVDRFPSQQVLDEIDAEVDFARMEKVLMEEGVKKFANPQKELLLLIAEKRRSRAGRSSGP